MSEHISKAIKLSLLIFSFLFLIYFFPLRALALDSVSSPSFEISFSQSTQGAGLPSKGILTETQTSLPQSKKESQTYYDQGNTTFFSAPLVSDMFFPLNYKINIDNQGKSPLKLTGTLNVINMFNQNKKETLTLSPQVISPSTSNEVYCLYPEGVLPCKSQSAVHLGLYKSYLSYTLNSSSNPLYEEIYTLAFPFSILILLIIITILIIKLKK